ncbi:MAG: hypothetical protein JNK55_05395 [Rubrivivax sp.]|nr:hypothetical protein [Rubrivivax sp.]
MSTRNRRNFRVTLMALCCLLLAQWSLLSHACTALQRAAHRVAAIELAAEVASHADCHGATEAMPADDPASSTLCMKHCADENSVGNGFGLVVNPAAAPPMVLQLPVVATPLPQHWEQAPAHDAARAPPLPILYCVSLT